MTIESPPIIDAARWEQGSILELSPETGRPRYPWPADASLWGSGRDAMRAILAHGRDVDGWRRLHCPSYMCQRVAAALAMEIDLVAYPLAPTSDSAPRIETEPGDVVLDIATFGRHVAPVVRGPAPIIEDHTHDPLSAAAETSAADYAVASLRKTFPLPDGGVMWSPRGHRLPDERTMTDRHARATLDRLAAMSLKRLYLEGGDVSKDDFRQLSLSGEEDVARGPISGISEFSRQRLASLPAQSWRERRAANLAAFADALGDHTWARLLETTFVATIVFDDPAVRDRVRARLIEDRIYPVVYWPLEERVTPGIGDEDIDLSRRILSIHCDQRYVPADMARVAQSVLQAVAAT